MSIWVCTVLLHREAVRKFCLQKPPQCRVLQLCSCFCSWISHGHSAEAFFRFVTFSALYCCVVTSSCHNKVRRHRMRKLVTLSPCPSLTDSPSAAAAAKAGTAFLHKDRQCKHQCAPLRNLSVKTAPTASPAPGVRSRFPRLPQTAPRRCRTGAAPALVGALLIAQPLNQSPLPVPLCFQAVTPRAHSP